MKTLTKSEFEQAANFLRTQARPLERALFAYYFEGRSSEAVYAELAKYQNADGGFYGLEADVRLTDSTVIATTMAFQLLRDLNAPADHPIVAAGCKYLLATYNPAENNWHNVPANIDDAPHAPWWTYDGFVNTSLSNSRAEIAGYLNAYPQHFPAEMRETVTADVVRNLVNSPDEMEMHDLLCNLRLWTTPQLAEGQRAAMTDKLRTLVHNTVARDPSAWREYGLPPLSVVDTPDSPFAADYAAEIPLNLDFMLESRSGDGTWKPNWSWDDQGTGAWEQAERELIGVMTLANLRKLKAFGRVE